MDIDAEIERLRGELAATQNVLVGIIRDTLIAKPGVKDRMLQDIRVEIERLETVPGMTFRREGAQRFYKSFSDLVVRSV